MTKALSVGSGSAAARSGPPDGRAVGAVTVPTAAPAVGPTDTGGSSPTRARWSLPLPGRPVVARHFEPPPQRWLAGHRGVDLLASPAAVITSPADGVVAFVGTVAGRPVLSILHGGVLRSTYEPVLATVRMGQPVVRGQPIGVLDRSEAHCPAASCLHWGLRRGSDYLDPLGFTCRAPIVLLPVNRSAVEPKPTASAIRM